MKRTSYPKHAKNRVDMPPRSSLKSRTTAAITAGCLAFALCPGIALAAPGDTQDMQGSANMPAMQQAFDRGAGLPGAPDGQAPSGQAPSGQAQDGQAPSGQAPDSAPDGQAPSGQAPDGQAPVGPASEGAPSGDSDSRAPEGQAPDGNRGGIDRAGNALRTDAVDNQVRQVLSDSYGVEMPANGPDGAAFESGKPSEAPELPEGAINVQKVIDSVRDLLRGFGVDVLEKADLTDEEYAAQLKTNVENATEERMQMFANGEKPSALPEAPQQGEAPDGNAPAKGEAPDGNAPGQPSKAAQMQQASETLLNNLVSFVMGVFGYTA